MDNPLQYQNSSLITKTVAIEVLDEFSKKLKWKQNGGKIIDVGCADGGITSKIYKTYLPANFDKIVGCDMNKVMVNFAKEHHENDKTTFMLLDIEDNLPLSFVGSFDCVFSFFTLHWIRKQRNAFENFFNLMAKDGQCLVTGFAYMPYFEVYRKLAQREQWAHFLENHENYISLYHDCKDPVPIVTELMKESGFKNVEVTCRNKSFVFDSLEALKNMTEAVTPFKIPKYRYEEYFEDFLKIALENNHFEIVNNNEGKKEGFQMKYRFIIAFGTKL